MSERLSAQPSFETQPSPEAQQLIEENAGLYARLLLACNVTDAADPSFSMPEIQEQMLQRADGRITTNIENSNYTLYSDASKRERTEKAAVAVDQLPQAVAAWSERTLQKIQQFVPAAGENAARAQKFAPYRETFQRFFGQIAGNGDISALTPEMMQEVYKRYCQNTDNTSDIKQFAVDVVRSFSTDQGGTLVLDEKTLFQNSEAIQWMASMFGSQSAEMVTSLIQAEVVAHTHRQTMLRAVNHVPAGGDRSVSRANVLNEREARILTFVSGKPYRAPAAPARPAPGAGPKPPGSGTGGTGKPDDDALLRSLLGVDQPPAPTSTADETAPDTAPPAPDTPPSDDEPAELGIHDLRRLSPPPPKEDADVLEALLAEEAPAEEPGKPRIDAIEPQVNVAMAQMFAQQLRERIKANPDGNVDPQSGIELSPSATKEQIDREWFYTGGFVRWASENNLPLVFWLRGGHATLLLGPPERVDAKTYRIKVYDPMQQGAQQERFQVDTELSEYMFKKKQEYQKYYDTATHRYNFPVEQQTDDIKILGHSVDADKIDEYIFADWLVQNSPRGSNANYNEQGLRMLASGTYNLDLSSDTELHQQVIHSKEMPTQKNGWDCIPLSFFSAAMRFAAKSNDKAAVQQMNDAFARDFHVRFLTREELKKRDIVK